MALHETVASLVARHAETNQRPEAVSVLVVGAGEDEDIARRVAPLLAQRLYPDRRFGEVLHVERLGDYAEFEYIVDVEVVYTNGIVISRIQNNR
jgi:hypothetical protein